MCIHIPHWLRFPVDVEVSVEIYVFTFSRFVCLSEEIE